jgi:hypothetical protein
MIKRLVPLFALAALALPVSAVANEINVKGPEALRGSGFVRGELQATADAKPVRLRIHAGFVRIVDIAGDLETRAQGHVRTASKQDAQGHKVVLYVAQEGRIGLKGSDYRVLGFAMQYGMLVPDRVTGTLSGRLQECQAGADGKPACAKDQGSADASGDLSDLDAALSGH